MTPKSPKNAPPQPGPAHRSLSTPYGAHRASPTSDHWVIGHVENHHHLALLRKTPGAGPCWMLVPSARAAAAFFAGTGIPASAAYTAGSTAGPGAGIGLAMLTFTVVTVGYAALTHRADRLGARLIVTRAMVDDGSPGVGPFWAMLLEASRRAAISDGDPVLAAGIAAHVTAIENGAPEGFRETRDGLAQQLAKRLH